MFSDPWPLIFSTNVFRSASAAVYPLVTTTFVSYCRRRTASMEVQSQIFFDLARWSTALWIKISRIRRQIFSPSPEKVCSASLNTTVGASRDPAREKAVTVFPRGFSQWTRACTVPQCLLAWIYWWVITNLGSLYKRAWTFSRMSHLNAWLFESNRDFGRKSQFDHAVDDI